ncbi:MAG: class I SAM-dependent DNA methyltransferase [Lacunisphaera sp.]
MHWVASSEKDLASESLEKRLWDAADQFRANSGLKAQEYSSPILGLIFLRFAEVRFSARRAARVDEPGAYYSEGVLYLASNARFDVLPKLPEGADIGAKVNEAMRDIEKHNDQLKGVLPKTYNLFTSTLLKELLRKISEIPATADYDAFGRIYEYFLGEFARTEGQKGGEFYTPSCIVRLLTEIIEPYHGRILDPACGSGGMFVSSARFVAGHKRNPASELSIHGIEKTDETGRLCRMNLAVHGLEGDLKHGGPDQQLLRRPARGDRPLRLRPRQPAVQRERRGQGTAEGRHRRRPALPLRSPAHGQRDYLWIQLFHSALNAKGRAGFVMANSASDARASEQEIRQKLIESRAVDVMIAVGPNLFYTVTLPCTLWFFDKGKVGRIIPMSRIVPTPFSSSTPATFTAKSTARTASGHPRRSASSPTSSAFTATKPSTSPSATRWRPSSRKSLEEQPWFRCPDPRQIASMVTCWPQNRPLRMIAKGFLRSVPSVQL